jgi:hypothetical protein
VVDPPGASFEPYGPPGPQAGAPVAAIADAHASSRPFAAPAPLGAPGAPLGGVGPPHASSSPFSAPPWKSGQPAVPPDRSPHPWSVVELPAIDPAPALIERQRRIFLCVVAGLVGLVVLIAILAGR